MKKNMQIDQARRSFFKYAGLLSLGITFPRLSAGHSWKNPDSGDAAIEIRTGNKVAVLITVVSVAPENQQEAIALFEEGTSTLFSKLPGYISSSIHVGNDGKHLVLYGQWENQGYIDAFRKSPSLAEYFQKVKAIATFESVVCNAVTFVHHK